MFGRQSGLSGNAGSSNLIEFRAGRMNMVGKTVHADKRKGLVYLSQGEDGLMHFCWKDRTSGKVEDDLIVFPDDFEFKKVEQCKTGRVFVLKYKSSTRRMFFWMQEPKSDKDDEYCRRVNELMNNPPSAQRGGGESGDLQYMLNNMSQQQLMQLFGGVGQMGGLTSLLGSMNRPEGSGRSASRNGATSNVTTTPESNATTPRTPSAPRAKPTNRVALDDSKDSSAADASGSKSAPADGQMQIDLSDGLVDLTISNSDAISVLTCDPDKVKKLAVLLPKNEADSADKKKQIKETIASPQFQQALTSFCSALQSAQLGPVVSHFELTPDAIAAAYSGNLEDFVNALEKALPAGATMEKEKKADSPQKMEHSGEDAEISSKQPDKEE